MQEHIRRAHPEHYISKLPATEESFALMISTPPSEKPRQQPQQPPQPSAPRSTFPPDRRAFYDNRSSSPATPRTSDEYPSHSLLPAASAAAALAQLHNHRMDSDWDSEPETSFSDNEAHRRGIASSIELPPINHIGQERMFGGQHYDPTKPRQLLPSILSRSPPGRSSTLPPFQRQPSKSNRPRKSSVTQNARKPRHEKKSSREHIRRMSYDRKAFSAEPSGAALGKRWEDLIDAATSATEEPTDEDRTPVPPSPPPQHNPHRASLPPFPTVQPQFQSQSYQASPLQHALTPPSYAPDAGPEPFPSVESSGENFHIGNRGLEGSMSPAPPRGSVEHYCAACRRLSVLGESYAFWGAGWVPPDLVLSARLLGEDGDLFSWIFDEGKGE
ncbi:MAG: hypothetical protein M1814_000881 [Vezdaea aestivalis]|nr:MAG: hypothetical protein M1814_000881 [Vezdaea aestivalis]